MRADEEAELSGTAETEMVRVLKLAMETGDVLDVPTEAKRIATQYQVNPEKVARDLTDSGLLVGANMAMGSPQ